MKSEVIHSKNILEGITVLDFSHRLPGPTAGMLLRLLGARVIKIEDEKFKDAFLSGLFSSFDSGFVDWYEEINKGKELVRLPFDSENIQSKILPYLEKADALISGLPPKVESFIGIDQKSLEKIPRALVKIQMGGSEEDDEPMHDLNAMAKMGLLQLYIADRYEKVLDPPFMPLTGISFGHFLSSLLLGGIVRARAQQKTVFSTGYLYDSAKDLYSPYFSQKMRNEKRTRFLHNGAYPCYSLYLTKDEHYVGMACVEEKFYAAAHKLFGLPVPIEERFDPSAQAFEKMANFWMGLTLNQIRDKIGKQQLCISFIERL